MTTLHARRGDAEIPFRVDEQTAVRLAGRRFCIGTHGYVMSGAGLLHRELLGLVPGDRKIGDHINGDRLDNRAVNLRVVDPSMSSSNVRGRARSGYRGVYPNKDRWAAAAKKNGKKIHIGTYDTPQEAARVSQEWRQANLPGYVER
jgi:hypothetical protein